MISCCCPSPQESWLVVAANVYSPSDARSLLSLSSGIVFANPIPRSSEIPKQEINKIINIAVEEARSSGIIGKDNTPYILRRINQLTDGRSLIANKALIESNVVQAAKVAVHLAALKARHGGDRFLL